MGSGNFEFRSGRAGGGAISFYISFFLEGKVGNKIKHMTPQIGRAGAGKHFIFVDGVLLGLTIWHRKVS